jgi:predicted amidophosphoribosyltransferase
MQCEHAHEGKGHTPDERYRRLFGSDSRSRSCFRGGRNLEGKNVLLLDDLFQSGASMNVAAKTLKERALVKSIYALALTRTRC